MRCGPDVAFAPSNGIDDYNREVLKIEIDTSLPARRIVRALDELIAIRGKPVAIRLDNGPELVSDELELPEKSTYRCLPTGGSLRIELFLWPCVVAGEADSASSRSANASVALE